MDHVATLKALASFGVSRVMAESNWFVNEAMGHKYGDTFEMVLAATRRAGYTAEQTDAVFVDNAVRVYSLAL
jgi:predicted TIM-barrel fold metal-dependent hydrolase